MPHRFLTALPVYNEMEHVAAVLAEVRRFSPEVLVVDDGSTDGTSRILAAQQGIQVVGHAENRGYGAALRTAFDYAQRREYEVLVTIDCDGQHEPQRIPRFAAACADWDIVSGSRYLKHYPGDSQPPAERRRINERLTAEVNRRLGLKLTDAFCGFKAYRVESLGRLQLTETGYAMPLELWVQAAQAGLRICELPVPLIYLDEKRSFGGSLDDARRRLEYYHLVLQRSLAAVAPSAGHPCPGTLGSGTLCGECAE
jgi:dolichol-phosphate mannosyltransferase